MSNKSKVGLNYFLNEEGNMTFRGTVLPDDSIESRKQYMASQGLTKETLQAALLTMYEALEPYLIFSEFDGLTPEQNSIVSLALGDMSITGSRVACALFAPEDEQVWELFKTVPTLARWFDRQASSKQDAEQQAK